MPDAAFVESRQMLLEVTLGAFHTFSTQLFDLQSIARLPRTAAYQPTCHSLIRKAYKLIWLRAESLKKEIQGDTWQPPFDF